MSQKERIQEFILCANVVGNFANMKTSKIQKTCKFFQLR